MYLKKITIKGFKSFADKTVFDLDKGITGVVGPNGSGKSNVVDAIRWVLGEQSTKSLRASDVMTDVIFAGSKSRSASNQASVTITFDNSDKFMNVDYSEIEIRRQVYHDGTNEYYINNEKCRLKDITEFLIDSNIGKESFSIISQGKIDDILSSKPSDRRLIFEDAAGVLKYKKRKEDAVKKLDRTSGNIDRINDIINELENNIEPLSEQASKAKQFNEYNDELHDIEIALIASDITSYNEKYKELKENVESLNNETIGLSTVSVSDEAKCLDLKGKLENIDNELNVKNKELLDLSTKVEQVNTKRLMILERSKYDADDSKMHDVLVNLKNREYNLKNSIDLLNKEINKLKNELDIVNNSNNSIQHSINEYNNKRLEIDKKLKNALYNKQNVELKIESLNDRINNNLSLPTSVSSVLNNPKLNGIRGTIGALIEIDSNYELAINTCLGGAISYVVVDDEKCGSNAIAYLKENKLGRATFFPISIIKGRNIDGNIFKKYNGYLGIASDFVKTDKLYQNIIDNQLGNIVVVDNIDNANNLARSTNYNYRVVTLDGSIIHTGGSMTGGTLKVHNIITDKQELVEYNSKLEDLIKIIKNYENDINEIDYNINECNLKMQSSLVIELIESIKIKNKNNESYNEELNNIISETNDINAKLDNTLDKAEENIILEYQNVLNSRENLMAEIEDMKKKRSLLYDDLNSLEFSVKKNNSLLNEKERIKNENLVSIAKLDAKLDNLLNVLSENYNMTYESACEYRLEFSEEKTRTRVNSLKRLIKELGSVNVGSIDIYEQMKTRYEFLIKQREDLVQAENMLLEIIEEMDKTMSKEFVKTFELIRDNFKIVFKELFKGGEADLKLTDPNDILNTGIDIIAYPPGKKLGKTVYLSGGEKTFTAISILFAILKTKSIPFCVFDEVEAALDEVNVVSFDEYIQRFRENTQFIIITHKKKTMEYADALYGITMQESGVSKLVSVKLKV